GGGNYNPTGFLAAKPVVDFMQSKADPRLRIFYRPNGQGLYVGSPTSPDTCKLPTYQALYLANDTPFSYLQHRLFTPNYNENDGFGAGTGNGFFPVLTYAEYCFIRADLAARGITNDDASTWYTNGVTASINFYDQRAKDAGISNYVQVSSTEITNYLAAPGVAFDASKATEQIACQAYLDFFRQPSEAWAWWKRTGFPNTTSVLAWSQLTSNGTVNAVTRRAALTLLPTGDANYTNQKAAYDAMAADPGFGTGIGDAFGRIWWDQQ
ncbi:MAG: SusD/RagB family nutrient-binding outer membrane lipoprotein, partial [Bacteroidetes bacterium]|nr:SusD/RagB family nutrient-binding outer membrane lipoprotein [Bacteroidota bacterium]